MISKLRWFVVLLGGDNYRKEHRRQCVKYLEVEAEKLPLNGDLSYEFSFGTGSENASQRLEPAQVLGRRNWV